MWDSDYVVEQLINECDETLMPLPDIESEPHLLISKVSVTELPRGVFTVGAKGPWPGATQAARGGASRPWPLREYIYFLFLNIKKLNIINYFKDKKINILKL